MRRPMAKVLWRLVGLTLLLVVMAAILGFRWRQPEFNAAMRGEKIAWNLGCFGCHGSGGVDGISDPSSLGGKVPGWDRGTVATFLTSEQELREWILYGRPRQTDFADVAAAPKGLIPMPAYEGRLSDQELDDLVAYFWAVSGWDADMPDTVYEGMKMADRLGCFGCHGPSGMGGVPNPRSFTGRIPPLSGDEFEELVHDDIELRTWILDGSIPRLDENPLARRFLDRQIIQMPAYREHISDDELGKLMSYIRWQGSR